MITENTKDWSQRLPRYCRMRWERIFSNYPAGVKGIKEWSDTAAEAGSQLVPLTVTRMTSEARESRCEQACNELQSIVVGQGSSAVGFCQTRYCWWREKMDKICKSYFCKITTENLTKSINIWKVRSINRWRKGFPCWLVRMNM